MEKVQFDVDVDTDAVEVMADSPVDTITATGTVVVYYYRDDNYGADADGLRGEVKYEIADIRLEEVEIDGCLFAGSDVSAELRDDILTTAEDMFYDREMWNDN